MFQESHSKRNVLYHKHRVCLDAWIIPNVRTQNPDKWFQFDSICMEDQRDFIMNLVMNITRKCSKNEKTCWHCITMRTRCVLVIFKTYNNSHSGTQHIWWYKMHDNILSLKVFFTHQIYKFQEAKQRAFYYESSLLSTELNADHSGECMYKIYMKKYDRHTVVRHGQIFHSAGESVSHLAEIEFYF